MSFAKLASMLSSQSLYFSHLRVMRRGELSDAHEGKYTPEAAHKLCSELSEIWKPHVQDVARTTEQCLDIALVNCWCLGEHESDAMWRLYGEPGGGVAVCSTYRRLFESLPIPDNDQSTMFYLSMVQYGEVANPHNGLSLVVTKRRVYEHEREVRALMYPGEKQ